MKNTIITIIIILSFCFGYWVARTYRNQVVKLAPVIDPNYVQNIGEAQRRLKEQGLYHGKIDYIWGPKMEKAYCNYCGIREIEGE